MVHHVDIDPAAPLHPIEDVQPPPAAGPLHGIGGVGDVLQLIKDKARNNQVALHETGVADIGNPAVDNDTGIENPVIADLLGRPPAEQADLLHLLRAENKTQITHGTRKQGVDPGHNLAFLHDIANKTQTIGKQERNQETNDHPHHPAQDHPQGDLPYGLPRPG